MPLKTFRGEQRVYRQVALPVSAFDALKELQRAMGADTNAEVLSYLLVEFGPLALRRFEDPEG